MNKTWLISFVLSAALFAPNALAMFSNLLPRARHVAAIVMNSSVRNAVTQGERTVANAARNGAHATARATVEQTQSVRQPLTQSLSRSFTTQASRTAQTGSRSGARLAAGVGLAGAIGGAVTYVHADGEKSSLPKDFLTATDKNTLIKMMDENSDYARQFAQLVSADNFMSIDTDVLQNILYYYPDAAKMFAPYAVANIELTIRERVRILGIIIRNNPETAEKLTPYALENIASLMNEVHGLILLRVIMSFSPKVVKALTSYAQVHFASMVNDDLQSYILEDILKHNPEAAKVLHSCAMANVALLLQDMKGLFLLNKIIKGDAQRAKELIIHMLVHSDSLGRGQLNMIILSDLIEENPEAFAAAQDYIVKNFKFCMKSRLAREVIKKDSKLKERVMPLSQTIDRGTLYDLWLDINEKNPTPTQRHLQNNYSMVETVFGEEYDLFPGFRGLVKNVIALEKEYGPKGYYTFVHAQQWPYHMTEALYRRFKEITMDTELPYFRYMFTKEEHHDEIMQQMMKHKEEKIRQDVMGKGRETFENGDARSRQLFLNTSFFGNTTNLGSSSAYYLSTDSNVSDVRVSLKDMFGMYGQEALYEKYKNEFDVLQREHDELSKGYGNMIFLAVPKDKVSDFVVQVRPGGYLTTSIVNGKETNDIKVILDALATDPSSVKDADKKEFVLAMTDTAGLDPKSGIEIRSVNAADPEKLAAWQKKFDALMTKIAPEFKACWNQKVAQARISNQPIYDAIKPVSNAAIFHRVKNLAAQENQK